MARAFITSGIAGKVVIVKLPEARGGDGEEFPFPTARVAWVFLLELERDDPKLEVINRTALEDALRAEIRRGR